MIGNEHAALRLAHPTVVPDGDGEVVPESADDRERPTDVDVTGSHPTVRATPIQGD